MKKYLINFRVTNCGLMSQKEVLAKDEDKARKKLTDEIISDLKKKDSCGCLDFSEIITIVSAEEM